MSADENLFFTWKTSVKTDFYCQRQVSLADAGMACLEDDCREQVNAV
ncbi:MAG: hypothetical protein H0W76_18670 [Pyrinomonadaceae bacterium]|nr:hypothetical protein [Pyrinomonadaceae bacterium]